MRTAIVIVAATVVLTAEPASAQSLGGIGYNPYTGRLYSDYAARNPWTGSVERQRSVLDLYSGLGFSLSGGYNPWTGSFYRNRAYQNPWTGRFGTAGFGYNPWTGRYGYRYRW